MLIFLAGPLWMHPAAAAVVSSSAGGFVVKEEVDFPGTPDQAWQRLIHPQQWWSSEHTYSGSAANLSLNLQPGGCWCETLPDGGFVQHMTVAYAAPGKALRLIGGLGPLQGLGFTGALTFKLSPVPGGATHIVAEYVVTANGAADATQLAGAVDQVLGEQVSRLGAVQPSK